MKIIAHRGGAGLGCENTLSCISKGLSFKPDMIEIDVHLTKDGEVVVCHDPTLHRTTDSGGKIREMNLDEVRSAHIVDRYGRITEDSIPTLREVLSLTAGKADILLEIKRCNNADDGLEKACLDMINESGLKDKVTVQSFNDIVLERIHKMNPDIRLEKLMLIRPFSMNRIRRRTWIASYNIYFRGLITEGFVSRMHKMGKEVKVWTIQKPSHIPAHNLDGIITDRPDLFV